MKYMAPHHLHKLKIYAHKNLFFSRIHAYKVHIKHIRTVAYERQGKTVSYAGYIFLHLHMYMYAVYSTFMCDLIFMFIIHM